MQRSCYNVSKANYNAIYRYHAKRKFVIIQIRLRENDNCYRNMITRFSSNYNQILANLT